MVEGVEGVEAAEGAIWADWALGAEGAIGSEGVMKAEGVEGLRRMRGLLYIWVNFSRTGKIVKMWHFFYFFGALLCANNLIFQIFSTVQKTFCPLDSKNVFVLVLAY